MCFFGKKKKHYLDTVAIRSLSGVLPELRDSSITSAFTVFETISGISEEEFVVRRAAVRNLLTSGIEIDWRMPIDIIVESFKVKEKLDGISGGDVKRMAEVLISSSSYQDFKAKAQALPWNFDQFVFFDQRLSAQFTAALGAKENELRTAREEERKKKFKPIPEKAILSIARFISSHVPSQQPQAAEHLAGRYDRSIDIFVRAWLSYYDVHANLLHKDEKNDWADLLHMTYLGSDADAVLVSNDKKIRALMNSFRPGSAITIEQFNIDRKK